MSKLVDKERLAKLAQGLYEKLHAEVVAEKTRALAAEEQVLKDAKKYTDEEIVKVNSDNSALANRVGVLESFKAEQVQNNADQLALINGKVSQADYDGKMVLLDQKDNDLQAAINAEKTRAEGIEGGLDNRIKAIENDYLKAADKTELQGNIDKKVDQTAYNAKVQEIAGQIEALGVEDGKLEDAIEAEAAKAREEEGKLDKAIKAEVARAEEEEERIVGLVEAEVERAEGVEEELQGAIDDVDAKVEVNKTDIAGHKARIEALEGKFGEGEGTVEAQIAAAEQRAKKHADDEDDALEIKLQAEIDKKVAQADYDEFVEGYEAKVQALDAEDKRIAGLVQTEKERAMGVEQGLAGRLDVIEGTGEGSIKKAVADLVNGAPEAVDTLKELADEISKNKGVYDAYVEQHATAMANMKTELQAEIDSDVKVEADRAVAEEAAIRGEFAAADTALHATISKEIDADVKVEKDRAEGEEAKIREEFAAAVKVEKERAEGVEAAIRGEFAQADSTLKTALQKEIDDDVLVEKTRAEGKEAELLAAINKEIQDREADVNAEETRAKAQETAIRQEFADADKALHAQIKGEIGNIVGSLNLSIVNDEVVLKLGGVEGIELTSVKLDMASDNDIDEIINGLGVEE